MNFQEFLTKKNIDMVAFEKQEASLFKDWEVAFEKMHPDSFTMQYLFVINAVRRKYVLNKKE